MHRNSADYVNTNYRTLLEICSALSTASTASLARMAELSNACTQPIVGKETPPVSCWCKGARMQEGSTIVKAFHVCLWCCSSFPGFQQCLNLVAVNEVL